MMEGICLLDKNKRIIDADDKCSQILGVHYKKLIGRNFINSVNNIHFIHKHNHSPAPEITWDTIYTDKNDYKFVCFNKSAQPVSGDCELVDKLRETTKSASEKFLKINLRREELPSVFSNNRSLAVEIIHLISSSQDTSNLISNITDLIKEYTGIDAIGIRMKEGNDFPYYTHRGFSDKFIIKENFIRRETKITTIPIINSTSTTLNCFCGAVLLGRTDSKLSFYTKKGSFWTNSSTALLRSKERQYLNFCTNDVCNSEGYESIALIPLKAGSACTGLIQFNDRRPSLFSESYISELEVLAEIIGVALQKISGVNELKINSDRLRDKNNFLSSILNFLRTIYRRDISEDDKFTILLKVISLASKFPQSIIPKIEINGKSYIENRSGTEAVRFTKTIYSFSKSVGKIEFIILDDSPEKDDNIFLDELDNYLDTITLELEKYYEKHQVELLQKRTEIFFDSVWKNSIDGMRLTNFKGIIVAVNQPFCKLLDIEMNDVIGKHISCLYHDDYDLIKCEKHIGNIRDNDFDNYNYRSKCKVNISAEKTIYLDITYSVITAANQEPLILSIFRDITQEYNAEYEFKKIEKFATIGKLTSYLTHEIKTYLNPIKIHIELIEKKMSAQELERTQLTKIKNRIQHLEHLLKETLQFAKQTKADFKYINPHDIVNSLLFFYKPMLLHKSISGINNIDRNILVKGDFEKLQAVFLHLIENSIDAIEENSNGKIILFSQIDAKNNTVHFFIQDNGCGISTEKNIFEPFITTKATGTGLGLPLIKKYLEIQDASIMLKSSKPRYTVFEIIFQNNGVDYGNNISN